MRLNFASFQLLAWLMFSVSVDALSADSDFFPYKVRWDEASVSAVNLRDWNHRPAGRLGWVTARDGHLYVGKSRLRFFGVNVVFRGAMPERDEAEKIAARLAKLGFNVVRFHHMDTLVSPNGLLKDDLRTFDPAQLDKLDYFIAALKREGIYSDLNLHVGRLYPGFDRWRDAAGNQQPEAWKGVDVFYPPMVDQQKEYAKELLTHVNPYLGKRYLDEPAVAIVELNNENGLIYSWRRGDLDLMSEPYRGELQRLWNSWLVTHYKSDAGLRLAWETKEVPMGMEMLVSPGAPTGLVREWTLQSVGQARAILDGYEDGIQHLNVLQPGTERWHVQVHQKSLSFKAGELYTLHLRLRANKPRSVRLMAVQNHAPFRSLWEQRLKLDSEWQEFVFVFSSPIDEALARLTLGDLGADSGEIWIAGSSLRAGGDFKFGESDSLVKRNVPIFTSSDFGGRSLRAQRDWLNFLWDVEAQYWSEMQGYLKNKLGVKSLVIGTQLNHSPSLIQRNMDVLDAHAYWDHPRFPDGLWSPINWLIDNKAMAGVDGGGAISRLALMRLPGKPFVVTEYNHPAPNEFAAETFPLVAAYAAMQDWDGVFLFSYGTHSRSWKRDYVDNFFDINANPNKFTSTLAAAALFRRGDVSSQRGAFSTVLPSRSAFIDALRQINKNYLPSGGDFGVSSNSAMREPVALTGPVRVDSLLPIKSLTGQLVWGVDKSPTVSINTPLSKGLIGASLAEPFDASGVHLQLLGSDTGSGVVFLTLIDGSSFSGPGRFLITALGNSKNTNQVWVDKTRASLGGKWGQAPVLVEGVRSRITLPISSSQVRAWALDEEGRRKEIVVVRGNENAVIETGPKYKSLWYEVEVLAK